MCPVSKMNTKSRQTRKYAYNFTIMYNSTKVNGKQLSKSQTASEPLISFKPKKGKLYTIIMYDLHSPKPAYLHYMAINITDASNAHAFVPYQPPSPPLKDAHYHVYMFELYEQPEFLTVYPPASRSGFDPRAFTERHALRRVAQKGFYVCVQL
jgi:phosphatidylethanolamine-binding protein (PEBP) family uncharacterized protein